MDNFASDTPTRSDPTDDELAEWTAALLVEIEEALSSDVWAIIDSGSDPSQHRLYDAAALRHCAALLATVDAVARAGDELATRILVRSHIEAFLFALYIHFGGIDAILKIAQDTLYSLESTHNDLVTWDQWLEKEKGRATKARDKVRRNNAANLRWNAGHSDQPPRPILDEPYVPQLSRSGVDLSDLIASFGGLKAKALPVRTVVDALTKWGPEKGFGRESFAPMYHIYRVLSGGSLHPTLNVLDAYFLAGGFIRTLPAQLVPSVLMDARVTTLYSTAFLARRVLDDAGSITTVSIFLCNRLEPDPSEGRGWIPGS